jgi:MoaA/NifB/PqqE/SkfB family radical SAM enzyme
LKDTKMTLNHFERKKIESLKNTKTFCSAPWSHLHVLPDGNAVPCCIWDYGAYKENPNAFGNINDYRSVEDLMNNRAFRDLRKSFLSEARVAGCHRCYDREKVSGEAHSSIRHMMNTDHIMDDSVKENVLKTDADTGELDSVTLTYVDIRFGNICNLKCRMCGHNLSSTWYDEVVRTAELYNKPEIVPERKFIHTDCYEKVKPYLEHVREIYFAGGEPFLYPEHLKMLWRLIEIGNTDVVLKYNTNLSTLKYKKTNFVDVWKHFPNVTIGASIDDMDDVVEYIRTNSRWEDLKNNMNYLLENSPHVQISPSPTIGIMNLETFPRFHKYAIQNGWYRFNSFGLNYVKWPVFLDIYHLPQWYKTDMIDIYTQHQDWIRKEADQYDVSDVNHLVVNIEEALNRLREDIPVDVVNDNLAQLKERLDKWDETGNLDWRGKLPHLARMLDRHQEDLNDKK